MTIYSCDEYDMISRCIASAINMVHLQTCERLIEDRILYRGKAFVWMARELANRIQVRQIEIMLTRYPVNEQA
jgi:hypothetical protein